MNKQKTRLQVVKERCKVATKILSVFQGIMLVGLALILIAVVVIFAQKDKINQGVSASIASGQLSDEILFGHGFISVQLGELAGLSHDNYAGYIILICISASLICALCLVAFTILKKICTTLIAEETPFTDATLKNLRVIFIIITCFTASQSLGIAVITGVLLWCVYSIFEYGKELQTEVDETL